MCDYNATQIHAQSATYINTPSRTEHLNALARKDCVALYGGVRTTIEYGCSYCRDCSAQVAA